ncbi:hypothetical protein Gpo141_00001208 [Globisporangium polare]
MVGSRKRPLTQGLRQSRVVRLTGYEFQFSARVVNVDDAWVVYVESQVCMHNHPVDQDRFESYGSVRRVAKTHLLHDQVRQMVRAEPT